MVPLPSLLKAANKGDSTITLPDGSVGVLPEDWLRKYGFLTGLGKSDGDVLRFTKNQAALLDSMLATQPEITFDDGFSTVRKSLDSFQGIKPIDPTTMFKGELRPYQKEGLGWLNYLEEFEFGGVLADDMGLGKTVQVLAQLARWRDTGKRTGPSLIVVPKSLVFNWVQEAARFAPDLRVLDYTGPNRQLLVSKFRKYDLIVTTYGTLRSDIVELSKVEFDYVILDEAQAIKNSDSLAAKAARILKGKHRLAMSGTPIENHSLNSSIPECLAPLHSSNAPPPLPAAPTPSLARHLPNHYAHLSSDVPKNKSSKTSRKKPNKSYTATSSLNKEPTTTNSGNTIATHFSKTKPRPSRAANSPPTRSKSSKHSSDSAKPHATQA
jgi:hypothetical protein